MSCFKWIFVLSTVFCLGCANHHCRLKKEGAPVNSAKTQPSDRVLVAKPDGSQQCEEKSGISLDAMAQDLGEISIYRQFKKSDGLMRIQVCGAPTGMHNIYEIEKKDLRRAQDVGFKIWKGQADQ